jgi:hypothetical protein
MRGMKAALPIVLGALVLGAGLRAVGGVPLLRTDLVPAARASGQPAEGTPEEAAASFYRFIQQGLYEKAWEVSLEPAWPDARGASYAAEVRAAPSAAGWTAQADFISRCGAELGTGLKLNGVQAARMPSPPDTPEARVAAALGAVRVYGVHASGQMLGACLIYRWDRDLAVAETGGRYRVVLPGVKAARASFHEAWFSNLSLIGSLRASGR